VVHVTTCTLNRLMTACALVMLGTASYAADGQPAAPAGQTGPGIRVTIYPILVKAPIYGASVDLPSLPGGGEEGAEQSGSTGLSLNAAYMGGALVEADRWFAEGFGVWAALSATRSTPGITVKSDAYFFSARGGVRLVDGLSATGGVRRVRVDLDTTLELPVSHRTIDGTFETGVWDPMIGVDYRHTRGSWTFDGNFQGGGFGVGTDVDLSAEVHARWRVVKHVELRAGYSLLYFKLTVADVSIGSFQRTLVAKQSLHGPEVGLGIVF